MAQDVPFSTGSPNFLFIGNSFTGQNDLASIFENIVQDGIPEWKDLVLSRAIEEDQRTLGAHLMYADGSNGDENLLRQTLVTNPDPWKWVTLQDQSQVPGFYQWHWQGTEYWRSTQAAIELNDYVANLGGQTMFFMTWGWRDGDEDNKGIFPNFLAMQDHLAIGYNRYKDVTSTSSRPTYVAPVGLVFKTIYNDEVDAGGDPLGSASLFQSLYAGDGQHPSIKGTYAAALTIYTSMTGMDPRNINWFPPSLDETTGRHLQDAVGRTIMQTVYDNELDYPWTNKLPVGTSPPTTVPSTTQAPTSVMPTTQAPTTAAPSTPIPTFIPPTTTSPTSKVPTTPAPVTRSPTTPPKITNSPSTLLPTSLAPSTQVPTAQRPTTTSPTTSRVTTLPPVTQRPAGMGAITITIQYDEYPEEISWTLSKKGTTKILYSQPFGSNIAPFATVSKTFDSESMEPNANYVFEIRDSEGDGICCRNGEGSIRIYDENQKRTSFFVQGEFQESLAVEVRILGLGYFVAHGTWQDMKVTIPPIAEDNTWPGAVPTQPTFSLMINTEVDLRPQDLSWILRHEENPRHWSLVNTWDGSNAEPLALESTELVNLKHGWYHLLVKDVAQNGLCCDFGRGYISVIGPIARDAGKMGMVWGNNGQFLEEEEIFFHISSSGYVSHVGWGSL